MGAFFLIFCVLIQFVYGQDFKLPWKTLYCPFTQNDLIGSNSSNQFQIEYVNLHDYVKIPCCQKYYINITKGFYHRNRFYTDDERPLLRSWPEMAWYIPQIEENQTGAYYCKDDFSPTNEFTFVYLIDIENPNVTTIKGKIKEFQDYTRTYLDPLNEYLSNSNDQSLVDLQEKTGLKLVAGMRWDPWTDCDFCAGEKSRKGRCHFIPVINDETGWDHCVGLCELYKNSLHLDCRSYYSVQKMFPKLAEMTKDIPNFRAVAKCVGPCITDAPAGINYVKKLRTRIMNVGDSAVFSCPGFDRKKRCYWKHNGNLLTSNEYDPLRHASVNELCMLYLNSVTKKEKGNFSCYLNDVIIQQNKVIVDVVYAEVTQAWWRHIVYLLYVIFLCMIIIIGGCVIGCLQMGNFKKVKTEDVIEMYATRRMEYEKLLPAE